MAQFARPSSDVALGGWSSPSFSRIDEAVADDADFTSSPSAPNGAALTVALSPVEDPQSSAGHVVRYRYGKDSGGGAVINLSVALMQGSTVIATWSHNDLSPGFTEAVQTLSAAQADAITDYSALRLRFTATQA